jgi:2-oxoglutarate ferredoxin oxidoreductase subunit beta
MKLPEFPVALGIIRDVQAVIYEDVLSEQIKQAKEKSKYKNLDDFFASGDVWEIKNKTATT